MRVASFNILNGRSLSDGEVDAGRLRDAVKLLDADVLGLQEVDRDQPRSHRLDLTAEVAAAMGGEGRFARGDRRHARREAGARPGDERPADRPRVRDRAGQPAAGDPLAGDPAAVRAGTLADPDPRPAAARCSGCGTSRGC